MKKTLGILLLVGLILGIMPLVSLAQEQGSQKIQLEKAIEIAKSIFSIPQGYDQFDSSYDQDEFINIWVLRWSDSKGDGRVTVRVDAGSGEIAGYSAYSLADDEAKYGSIPKISRTEGEKIALDFLKKAAPSKVNQVTLEPADSLYNNASAYHEYNFTRTINGIEYPANNISVQVNGQTGQVRRFDVEWENTNVAPIVPKLTREDGEKIFREKFGFELQYFLPASDGKTAKPIMLVYALDNPFEVTIDATNGAVVEDDDYGLYDEKNGMGGMIEEEEPAYSTENKALEPFEQKIADELKELIPREQALEIAQKAANIPANYPLLSSSLNGNGDFPESRVWSFDWELLGKNYYGWASAEVDAKTGKVLAFSQKEKLPEEETRPLKIKTKAEAEKAALDFLQAGYPEAVGNLRLQIGNDELGPEEAGDKNNKPSYSFRYERLVNNIPFRQDYVSATVDSYTGKVSRFRIHFLDLDFPEAKDLIDKDQFTADFLAQNQMILLYTKDQQKNLHLVYKLAPLESYHFHAQNGQMIGYDGEPVKERQRTEITDIKGHWAEQDINTLDQMGLLHYENGLFHPDGEISQAEVIKALVKSTNSYYGDAAEGNWYDTYYREAKQSGLITEKEINPQAPVTREELAKFMTRAMGGEKFAALNIYKIDFKDGTKVSPGYAGYVAIVHGLGIMTGDGSSFNPRAKLLKGEACAVLIRYLKTEK
ncbi:S-layer homology domain-containing protein [Candidatus Formimonas warabiya]|uniref:SLH domain-containing protein n=1 Tax=Formimonas warabiya TaxID=1761012 RepID=A0A3G1KW24_FORW1|nr:S-layer homology domain-containing protein [Candidatus Formimonas warabiya]ATW26620.1 hypothetical protein DCMF_19355 [Candidatus Formimonas warabiya]